MNNYGFLMNNYGFLINNYGFLLNNYWFMINNYGFQKLNKMMIVKNPGVSLYFQFVVV